MGKLVNSSGEEIFVFPGSVGIDSLPEERLTVAGNISSTGNLSAGDIVGTWRGTTLSSSQITVDSIDLKAYDVTEGLFLKSLGDGSVSWDSIPSSSASSTIGTIENTVTIQGDITATGDLHATNIFASNSFVSAGQDLLDIFATSSGNLEGSGTANTLTKFVDSSTVGDSIIRETGSRAIVGGSLSATGLLDVDGDTTILGNLSVHGDMHYIDTNVTVTSALSVVNSGTGPALYVQQKGSQPIAHFVDANGDDIVFSDNGYVGIGIPLATLAGGGTTPQERLTVSGNISALGALSATGSGNNYLAGTVGIGTIVPAEKLTVYGNISASGSLSAAGPDNNYFASNVGIGTNKPEYPLHVGGSISLSLASEPSIYQGALMPVDRGASQVDYKFRTRNAAGSYADVWYVDTSSSNFGIGTCEPAERLTVAGNISASGSLSAAGPNSNYFAGKVGIGTNKPARDLSIVSSGANALLQIANCDTGSTSDNGLEIFMSSNSAGIVNRESGYLRFDTNNSERMRIASDGKVGIGATAPAEKLTVAGNISARDGVCVGATTNGFVSAGRDLADIFETCASSVDGSGTANYVPLWSDSDTLDNSLLRQHSSGLSAFGGLSASGASNYFAGNVGIGRTGTSAKLHVGPHSLVAGYTSDRTTLAVSDTTSGAELILRGKSPRIWFDVTGGGMGEMYLDSAQLNIYSGTPSSTGSSRLYIKAGGAVGIGTTTPAEKLTVSGNISASGDVCVGDDVIVGTGGSGSITVCGAESKIHLCDTTDSDDMFMTFDNSGTTYACLGYLGNADFDICTNNRDISLLPGTHNVGIGTTTPGEKLTVAGNISASGSLSAAATTYGFVSAGRDLGDILVRTKGDQTMSGIKTFSSPATFSMPTRGYVTTFDYLGSVSPAGQRAFITDAQGSLADYIGVNAGGGGSYFSPVYSDGSNWIQG